MNDNNKTGRVEDSFIFTKSKIVGKQGCYKKQLINQMIEIRKHNNGINKYQDIEK